VCGLARGIRTAFGERLLAEEVGVSVLQQFSVFLLPQSKYVHMERMS
jgi:hypothetical protein